MVLDAQNNQIILIFGEVLFDYFPDGTRVLGGAPFNVAWHLQAFGENPRFISRIGNDDAGKDIASAMETWGINRDFIQVDPDHATGKVKVEIDNGEPSFDIVNNSAFDYIADASLPKTATDGVLYHGTLALRSQVSAATLQSLKSRHQGKIFIDINLRPPWWRKDLIRPLLIDANWVKLNETELQTLNPGYDSLESSMLAFSREFELDVLVVTRGALGATACTREQRFFTVFPRDNIAIVDTVGAGDAFSAATIQGLVKNWPMQLTLNRAQDFATAIVERRGATVIEKDFYQTFL